MCEALCHCAQVSWTARQCAFGRLRSRLPGLRTPSCGLRRVVRGSEPREPEQWRPDAETSRARRNTHRCWIRLQALALQAMSNSERTRKLVRAFRSVTERDPTSFAAWFGLGECQRLTPSCANSQGFPIPEQSLVCPVVLSRGRRMQCKRRSCSPRCSRRFSIRRMQRADARATDSRMTSNAPVIRQCHHSPPTPSRSILSTRGHSRNFPPPNTWLQATRRGRAIAIELARRWTARWPESSSAWLQYALALEMAGRLGASESGPSAEDALAHARRVQHHCPGARAHRSRQRACCAAARRSGCGSGRITRSTRDAGATDPYVRMALAPIAALVGDVGLALRLAVPDTERIEQVPADVADSVTSFRVRANIRACEGLSVKPVGSRGYVQREVCRTRASRSTQGSAAPGVSGRRTLPRPRAGLGFPPERALDSVYARTRRATARSRCDNCATCKDVEVAPLYQRSPGTSSTPRHGPLQRRVTPRSCQTTSRRATRHLEHEFLHAHSNTTGWRTSPRHRAGEAAGEARATKPNGGPQDLTCSA